jgi:DNA polymerase-3 subunit gamma/tau
VKIPVKPTETQEQKPKQEQPSESPELPVVTEIKKTSKPLSRTGISSGFSISSFLNKEETTVVEEKVVAKTEQLPKITLPKQIFRQSGIYLLKQLQRKRCHYFQCH